MCLKEACTEHQEEKHWETTYSSQLPSKRTMVNVKVRLEIWLTLGQIGYIMGLGDSWVKLFWVLTNLKASEASISLVDFLSLFQIKQKSYNKHESSGKCKKGKPLLEGTCLKLEETIVHSRVWILFSIPLPNTSNSPPCQINETLEMKTKQV